MAQRETLADFDIYRELVDARLKADVRSVGRYTYRDTAKLLGGYAAVTEEARETVARGEAQKAEDKYLAEWRRGKHRYDFGLGIGVRALLRPGMADTLTETFVPDPPELGAPEVVEVELPDSDETLTGLILPEGTFDLQDPYHPHSRVEYVNFYAKAQQVGSRAVGLANGPTGGPMRTLMPYHVVAISDSGGAYWEPWRIQSRPLEHENSF